MINKFTLIVLFLVHAMIISAQDYLGSSSYFMNPLSLNTAYSAAGEDLFLAFQANKYTGSQSEKGTEYISFGGYYNLGKGLATGLRMSSQSLGMVNYQIVDGSMAYTAGFNKRHYMSFSMAVGLLREKLEYADVKYSPYVDQNDPLLNAGAFDQTKLILGGGVVYNVYKLQLSLYMPYLVKGQKSLQTDFTAFAKYIYTNPRSTISVENYGLYKYYHDGSGFYDAGLLVGYSNTIWLNVAYRSNSSLNAGFVFEVSDFRFGYNYNYPFGDFKELISGKHELTVTFSRADLEKREPQYYRYRR